MRVKSPQKLGKGEADYISELGWPAGWLCALSVAISAIAVGYVS
jgi:hypothetical protein